MKNTYFMKLSLTALFSVLIILGAFISIPMFPAPIVLANFFVLLAGLILGPIYGSLSVILYILLGILGLPVFAAGNSGIGYLLGNTGGFLLGYIALACISGLSSTLFKRKLIGLIIGSILGIIILYAIGIPWLASKINKSIYQAFLIMTPYFFGDALKSIAAILIVIRIKPILIRYLYPVKKI